MIVKMVHGEVGGLIDKMHKLFFLQLLLQKAVFSAFLLSSTLFLHLFHLLNLNALIDVVTQNSPYFYLQLFDDEDEALASDKVKVALDHPLAERFQVEQFDMDFFLFGVGVLSQQQYLYQIVLFY